MAYIGRTPTNAALTAADLADGIVSTAKIAADAVTDAKIADDVVGTEHLTANEVDTAALKGDAVTGAELADNAVNSEHYTDGSIDNAHIADDAIDSEHYAAGSIDTAHIADNQITLAKLAGGTDGNIISFDASGDPVAIATGNDGQVLTSTGAGSPPAFEAVAANAGTLDFQSDRSSNLSVSANTLTEIVFNAEAIDTGGKYNTSTGRYTPAVAGNYFVHASVSCEPGGDHDQAEQTFFKIRKNGVDTEFGQVSCSGAATDMHFSLSTSAIITLDSDDYISVWMYTQRALTLFSDQCSFNGFRLS
jgi:hypothetical protein